MNIVNICTYVITVLLFFIYASFKAFRSNFNLSISLFHCCKNINQYIFYSVRTPGGKLVYQYLKKPKKTPRCGHCKDKLRGIQPARPMERSRMCKRKKTVKRVYGGVLCHKCVKERYIWKYFNNQYFKCFLRCVKNILP